MRRQFPALIAVLAFVTTTLVAGIVPAQAHKCGTAFAIQNRLQNQKHKAAGGSAARVLPAQTFAKSIANCDAHEYYDSVYTRETEHFQIFYTLGEGPHATIPEFIDSLASSLEDAFYFHTKTMGMRTPQGIDTTSHYQMPVKKGLYPIEVAEINFLRDPQSVLGATRCNGCYGVTYPDTADHNKSAIIIDNDFMFITQFPTQTASIDKGEKSCTYPLSTETLYNHAHGYSYSENWANAIRVTAFHEMFHAIQLRYADVYLYGGYWVEASATANEEIGAPDIDDYFLYVPDFIRSTAIPLDEISDEYSISVLYLYLYKHVDQHFDKEIWELFAKNPKSSFNGNLKKILEKRNLSVDSVFHDFATKLALSGEKANTVDSSLWLWKDQPRWPAPEPMSMAEYRRRHRISDETVERFEPDTTLFAFSFYAGGSPIVDSYKGKATALVFKGDRTDIRDIANTSSLDSINTDAFYADSIMWVFSRFDNPRRIPEIVQDSTLRAYPIPWRGTSNLCFTPLPESRKFIEIRNGRGDLVLREPYTKTTHCIDADRVRTKMAPGVYRFRAGSSGKMQKFLIVY
jgi:hypothetical protein